MDKGNLIIAGVTIAVFVGIGLIAYTQSQPPAPTSEDSGELVAANGLHEHPTLEIYINGEKQEIPANIGVGPQYANGPTYNPGMQMTAMHTHNPDGTIHLEFGGAVYEDDITLGTFFEIWGKEFSKTALLDNTIDNGGDITMTVNGATSTAYADYQVKDGDVIEIRYSTTTPAS